MSTAAKLDKFKTAMANGYNESQARALAKWTTPEFVRLINDMIRGDGKKKEWIFMDQEQREII